MVSKDIIKQKLFNEDFIAKAGEPSNIEQEKYREKLTNAHSEIYQLVQDEVRQEFKDEDAKLKNELVDSDNKIVKQINDNTKEIDKLKTRMNEVIERLNKL